MVRRRCSARAVWGRARGRRGAMADDLDGHRKRGRALRVDVVAGRGSTARAATGLARWLARVTPPGAAGDVTVALVSDARIRALNRRYRRTDRVTDVLSFRAESWLSAFSSARGAPGLRYCYGQARRSAAKAAPPLARARRLRASRGPQAPPGFLGDIVIAVGRARRQASEAGHTLATELRILALHGLLHLLGLDHERDGGRMARVERTLRQRGGLREGLIERARVGGARRRRR